MMKSLINNGNAGASPGAVAVIIVEASTWIVGRTKTTTVPTTICYDQNDRIKFTPFAWPISE